MLSRDRFGAHTIRLTFRDYKVGIGTQYGPGTSMRDEKKLQKDLSRRYESLRGQSFEIKQSALGEIWNITGLKTIQNRMAKALATDSMLQGRTDSIFSEEQIRKIFGQGKGALPSQPVQVGESWTHALMPISDNLGTFFKMQGKRTLKSLSAGQAVLHEEAQGIDNPEPIVIDAGNVTFENHQIATTGTSRVDITTGLITESIGSQALSGTIVIKNPPQIPPSPVEMKAQSRLVITPR